MKENFSNFIQDSASHLSLIRKTIGKTIPRTSTHILLPVFATAMLNSSLNSGSSSCTIASGYTYHKLRNIGKNSLNRLARKLLIFSKKGDTTKIYAEVREAFQRSEAFTT